MKIAKAWFKVLTGVTTEEDKRCAKICKKCPEARYIKYLDFKDNGLKQVKGMVCGLCLCPLVAKIRSTDKCDKWTQPTT